MITSLEEFINSKIKECKHIRNMEPRAKFLIDQNIRLYEEILQLDSATKAVEREVLGKWPKDPENQVIPTEEIKKKKQHIMAIFVSGDTTGAQDFFCEDWPPTSAEYLQMADLLEERSGRKAVITNFIELRTE